MPVLDMVDIGHVDVTKYNSNNTFKPTVRDYLTIAHKIINTFAYGPLRQEMLHNEEAISNVVTALMMADWRWNSKHQSSTGTCKNQYSYRNQCGIWAIKSYLTRTTRPHQHLQSLDYDDPAKQTGRLFHKMFSNDTEPSILDVMITKEAHDMWIKRIKSSPMTKLQQKYFMLHFFDGLNFAAISRVEKVSRENVRQVIRRGIKTFRSSFKLIATSLDGV